MDNESAENTIVHKRVRSTINRKIGDRERLSTTINTDVLNEFKGKCDKDGYKLSAVLEAFMRQYNCGEFTLAVVRNTSIPNNSSENDTIWCPEELKIE